MIFSSCQARCSFLSYPVITSRICEQMAHFLITAASRTMSLKGIMSLNDADAWAMFRRFRWPETQGEPVCPHCACTTCYDAQRPNGAPRYRCKACRKDFSPTSGTLFASHKLPIRDYLAAIALFVNAVKGISSLQLARDLGISAKTAWVLAHKLREAMAAEVKSMTIGGDGDIVEVDGCYVGGSVRQANRREDRKDRRLAMHQTGKRRVVVAARERKGRTLTAVFQREDEAMSFIRARVERGTMLHTDEASTWDELRARYDVQQVNHGEAFSHDGACTNQAESLAFTEVISNQATANICVISLIFRILVAKGVISLEELSSMMDKILAALESDAQLPLEDQSETRALVNMIRGIRSRLSEAQNENDRLA